MKKSIHLLVFLSCFSSTSFAFENVVSFGDSLSDGGNLDFFGSRTRYISGDDSLLYNEIIALDFTGKKLEVSSAGGTNYSTSGATASNTPLLIHKTEKQLNEYLSINEGKANKNNLYIFWAGANDITTDVEMSLLKLKFDTLFTGGDHYLLSDAPRLVASQVGTLLERGAGLVVVPNLPNAGLSPWTATALFGFSQMLLGGNILDLPSLYKIQDDALRQQGNVYGEELRQKAIITSLHNVLSNYGLNLPEILVANVYRTLLSLENRLTQQFNYDLESSLANLKGNIAYVDSYNLFQEMIDDPLTYGFDNILVPICQIGVGAPFCNSSHPSWHNDQTYLFSDWFHPSPEAHQIIAQYISSLISAPLLITQLEKPMQSLMLGQHSFIMSQLAFFRQNRLNNSKYHVFGGYQDNLITIGSSSKQSMGRSNLGVIIEANDYLSVGGALSMGSKTSVRLGPQLQTHYTDRMMSLFGQLLLGKSWFSTQVSVGDVKFNDITRTIALGKATRKERGGSKGNHLSGSINSGYDFTLGEQLLHGPALSVLYRKGKVNGFVEKSSSSSAMQFSRHRFADSYLSTGWRFAWKNKPIKPFFEINYIHPIYKKETLINGGLKNTATSFTSKTNLADSSTINVKLGTIFDINNSIQAFITADVPKIKKEISDVYYSAGFNFTF